MHTRTTTSLIALAVCVAGALPLAAQSAQQFSFQASALYTTVAFAAGASSGGAGTEAQLRYNPGRLSVGAGYQVSWHSWGADDMRLTGVFLEPRLAVGLGSDRRAFYVAARGAYLRSLNTWRGSFPLGPVFAVNGYGYGGGAGVLVFFSPRINLDLGAAYLRQTLDSKFFDDARCGAGSRDCKVSFDPINGYVLKAGVTIGLGDR
jgi:hypothetical protein